MKVKIFFAVAILLVLFGLYITYGERSLLAASKQSLNFGNDQSVKIVQFSDTHIGKYFSLAQLKRVVAKINDQKPQIVVFTGDLFDISRQNSNLDEVSAILSQIDAALGKFAIYGNRDYGGSGARTYRTVMQAAGFSVLVNESVQIDMNGKTISIYGADDYIFGYSDIIGLFENIDESNLNVLLSHEPDPILNYADYPIDLALSGHSHGGQVRLPVYGALIKTNFCDKFSKGLYTLENQHSTKIFVSSGLGNTKLPFRLGNIPEIVVFNLTI